MNKRPTSVTVIAWILLITSALSLVTNSIAINNPIAKEMMLKSPIPIPVQYVMLYAGLLIFLSCAVFILRGANWARLLYIAWGAISLLVGLFTSPMKMMLIPGIVLYGIFSFFLLRPKASAYFTHSAGVHNA